MKKILNLLLAACLVGFAACSKDHTEEPGDKPGSQPNFPAKISRTITSEAGTSFSVTPNLAWTVSIPETQEMTRYFKVVINNEELIGYSRKGEANTKLDIAVSGRTQDFENAHTLVMTLTMGGQSEAIAEIELMPAGSVLHVYQAKLQEDGKSFRVEEGQYLYDETPLADGATLELYDQFTNHLKVSANRNWKLADTRHLSLSQKGGNSGDIVEVDLASTDEIRPFEDAAEKLTFTATDDASLLAEFTVNIAGCANEFGFSIPSASNVILSAAAGTTTGSVTAAYGSRVFFASPDADTPWIDFAAGKGFADNAWSDEAKTAGLHTQAFTASYEANTSSDTPRTAYLFCLPLGEKSLDPKNALTADGAVAEAFQPYLLAKYTQQYMNAPREEGLLFLQSMVGKDNSSSAGQELFALLQEYNRGNYPTGWWGDALDEMPTLYRLTLRDLSYCQSAVMALENADNWKICYHPDDIAAETNWIREFGKEEGSSYYRFIFEYDAKEITGPDGETSYDITWVEPKYPEAYVIFTQGAGSDEKITGALIVTVDSKELEIPLQNASTNVDIGFSVLTSGNTGYAEKYSAVPQYKVNGYNASTGQPDPQGRLKAGSLTLTYSDQFDIDFTAFRYEPIEGGQLSGKLGWSEWDDETGQYVDSETREPVEAGVRYIFEEAPRRTGPQMSYIFGTDGPDQFRILCYNTKAELVCTVYIYYEWF